MRLPSNLKDVMYSLLKEPTRENFREFMKSHTGEHDSIDFKETWIEKAKLAKEMLAIANSGGGVIIFGVKENDDKTLTNKGIDEIKDKSIVSNYINPYVSSNLSYEIHDFSFEASEYADLQNKKFQMLVVNDTPQYLPFVSKKDGDGISEGTIFVRRGVSCEKANEQEISDILRRRMNYVYPAKGEPLLLDEHLQQLKVLYEYIDKEKVQYTSGIWAGLTSMVGSIFKGERVVKPNPLYPEEEYEEFVARMILEKKNKIERVLDLY